MAYSEKRAKKLSNNRAQGVVEMAYIKENVLSKSFTTFGRS
ncbi:MAG: hypothetical protein ACJAYB_000139 [Psychromonas sp.]|jgi:hypothetical protein